jgi:hypothetical protein
VTGNRFFNPRQKTGRPSQTTQDHDTLLTFYELPDSLSTENQLTRSGGPAIFPSETTFYRLPPGLR